jgi:rubredoxin
MEMKTQMTTDEKPVRYVCLECAYIYDPARGDRTQEIAPGIPFERLPRTWKCPECRISILKHGVFKKLEE